MSTKQRPVDFPEVQGAIYCVALSLDSFLMNGIPHDVIHRTVFNGFLQKTASNLLRELARLEQHAPHAPSASQPKVMTVLASLRTKCEQLIDLVTGLSTFRTLPLPQLRSTVAQIPLFRRECVQLIQELEGCFQTPKPFYHSRPSHSTAAVDAFLANLDLDFVQEWSASWSTHACVDAIP